MYLAQTPQAFRRDVLSEAVALGRSGVEATDEAMLAERAGHRVHVVEGDPANVKITTAERSRRTRGGVEQRTGDGANRHRLRPAPAGGGPAAGARRRARFRREQARSATRTPTSSATRSTDAVLGAACAGDIGRHYPDTDPRWKGASSIELLREAVRHCARGGLPRREPRCQS